MIRRETWRGALHIVASAFLIVWAVIFAGMIIFSALVIGGSAHG